MGEYINNGEYKDEYQTEDWTVAFYEATDADAFHKQLLADKYISERCMAFLEERKECRKQFYNRDHNGHCYSDARYHYMWSEITLFGLRNMGGTLPVCMGKVFDSMKYPYLLQPDSEFYNKETVIEKRLNVKEYRQPYVIVQYPSCTNRKGIFVIRLEKSKSNAV